MRATVNWALISEISVKKLLVNTLLLFNHGRVGSHRRTGRESRPQAAGSRQPPEPYLLARGVWERTFLRRGGMFDAIVEVVRVGEEVHALVILGRIGIIYE